MIIFILFGVVFCFMDYEIKQIPEGERGSRPSWDEYFMYQAIIVSRRASCKHVRAGSVFEFKKRSIGTGYNGAPQNYENCLEVGCRKDNANLDYEDSLNTAMCIGVHAEQNALGHLVSTIHNDSTLYTTIFPCHTCAKNLLSYRIKRVIFKRFYSEHEFGRTLELLMRGGVKVEQLDLSLERCVDILINLPQVDFDVFSEEEVERGKKYFEMLKE